jgi:hypothetical protein
MKTTDESKPMQMAMASWVAPLAGIIMLAAGVLLADQFDGERVQLAVILCGAFLQPIGLGLGIACLSLSRQIGSTAFHIHSFVGSIVSLTTTAALIVHAIIQSTPSSFIWDSF